MKSTMKWMKTGLVALILSTTAMTYGQTTTGTIEKGPLDLGPFTDAEAANRVTALGSDLVPAYEQANVVLFYNPNTSGSGLTLVASRTEDFTDIDPAPQRLPQDFTHYRWTYMGQDNAGVADGTAFNANLTEGTEGGEVITYANADDNKLPVTELTEGYHYFRVQGYIVPEGTDLDATCLQYSETFAVFVLPQLSITADRADGGTGPLQYCETDAGSQSSVVLKADATYASYAGNPGLDGFELRYNWYAIEANTDGSFDEPTLEDIGTLEPLIEDNRVTGTTHSLTPSISTVGTYKFFVEVEYTVKDRDYDGEETPDARKRTYALYRGWVGGSDLASATPVFVTPAPGKPHITIESVND